jgi:hypothetical protein
MPAPAPLVQPLHCLLRRRTFAMGDYDYQQPDQGAGLQVDPSAAPEEPGFLQKAWDSVTSLFSSNDAQIGDPSTVQDQPKDPDFQKTWDQQVATQKPADLSPSPVKVDGSNYDQAHGQETSLQRVDRIDQQNNYRKQMGDFNSRMKNVDDWKKAHPEDAGLLMSEIEDKQAKLGK